MDKRKCPLACPFIYSCNENVDYEHFTRYCFNRTQVFAYRECETYRKKAETLKKPREWLEELGGEVP